MTKHFEDDCPSTMFPIEKASNKAIYNALKINPNMVCSCYYCLSKYRGSEVNEYVDDGKTALCPVCGIDSVLPKEIDGDELQKIHDYYFKGD